MQPPTQVTQAGMSPNCCGASEVSSSFLDGFCLSVFRSWALSSGLSVFRVFKVFWVHFQALSVRHCSSAIAVGAEAAEGAGQARGRLLLGALPIKCSGIRCGGRKRQTLRHGLQQG